MTATIVIVTCFSSFHFYQVSTITDGLARWMAWVGMVGNLFLLYRYLFTGTLCF